MSYGDSNYRRSYNSNNNRGNAYNNKAPVQPPTQEVVHIDKLNYVETADRIMNKLEDSRDNKLTTSQIRNILAMVSDIYNEVCHRRNEDLTEGMQSRVQYLRLHIAYQAGREPNVKTFIDKAGILGILKEVGKDREKLMTFCHYMEALVAYHRFYGGKDH